MVQKSRQIPESYPCPTQQCNYSSMSGGTQCQTVYNTCTRYRTEYYSEQQTVAVDDDSCARRVTFAPNVGHTYLIQFDYLGGGSCEAIYFEELTTAQLVTCQVPKASGRTAGWAELFCWAQLFAALRRAKAKTKRKRRHIPNVLFDTTRLTLVPRLFN